jgi:hypothetical protein
MDQALPPALHAVIAAYTHFFGEPAELIPFAIKLDTTDLVIAVWLPEDPDDTTQLCTAGLSAWPIGAGFPTELGMEIKGAVEPADRRGLADAMVHIGTAPLQTGRPFVMGQTLTNVELPLFERFEHAMLMDWRAVYGVDFLDLPDMVLMRIVPLFEVESNWVLTQPDRRKAYLALYNRGMEPEDYARSPVDMKKP